MSFTRIPNKTIDEAKLNPYQFQLFSIIVRKTDGWCKVEDGISLSQFESMVTFKKPKIIATLKELEDMGYIEKTKQQNKNGGNSFNLYRISHTLVTENNEGSNSELQGVVTENYTQKKPNTKETITSNKKINKKPIHVDWLYSKEEYPNVNQNAFNEWMAYKKYKNKGAITKTLNMLNKYDHQTQQEMVDKSIMNEYKGLFEPKQKRSNTQNNVNVAQSWLEENQDTLYIEGDC